MLWIIALILLLLWLAGLFTATTFNGLVHLLLVVTLIVVIVRLIQGRKMLGYVSLVPTVSWAGRRLQWMSTFAGRHLSRRGQGECFVKPGTILMAETVLVVLLVILFMTGCNTWNGAGRDIERGGEIMQGE